MTVCARILALAIMAATAPAGADQVSTASAPRPAQAALPPRPGTVLVAIPSDASAVRPDVRDWLPTILERHGAEEWKATLLTNELHHHLGAYSILGAKMGVRAREILGAPADAIRVESSAGWDPPLSCLNDGLQVGSGATLGRGSFRLVEAAPPSAEAVFGYGGRSVRLRLRPEVQDRIRQDIARHVAEHGQGTPAYFEAVRASALRYWAELDRRQIFEEIGPAGP